MGIEIKRNVCEFIVSLNHLFDTTDSFAEMKNYTKGKNVEEDETWESIPFNFESCPSVTQDSCVWMKVKAGSKMRNLIPMAEKSFKEKGIVLFSGAGSATTKAVSIAEIIKRR